MAFGDSDLGAFFADMGVEITHNGYTCQGFVDANDQLDQNAFPGTHARVVETQTVVTVPTEGIPQIVRDGPITVDGVVMSLRDAMQEKDGAITYLYCVAAS
jgi:riboflavin synthase alpha subunit